MNEGRERSYGCVTVAVAAVAGLAVGLAIGPLFFLLAVSP